MPGTSPITTNVTVAASTIHRHLTAAGQVEPEPKKRPRSSYIRFNAEMPNQCWQSDFTHWRLADGTDIEILAWIDDHSRFILSLIAHSRVTGPIVVATFRAAIENHGPPASTLTAPTARIPEAPPPPPSTRPDPKPPPGKVTADADLRVRHDRIDKTGSVTLRHHGRLHHIGVGRTHARTHVLLLVAGLDIRVIDATTGELLRHLTLDPTKDYQPTGRPPGPPPET